MRERGGQIMRPAKKSNAGSCLAGKRDGGGGRGREKDVREGFFGEGEEDAQMR